MAAHTRNHGAAPPKEGVSRKSLVNRINFLNFTDQKIQCVLGRKEGGDMILHLSPLPSFGQYMVCLWPDELSRETEPASLKMKTISIPAMGGDIPIRPDIRRLTNKGVCVRLPDPVDLGSRGRVKNNPYPDMRARFTHQGRLVTARINGLTDRRLSLILSNISTGEAPDLKPGDRIEPALVRDGEILFSGPYIIERFEKENREPALWLRPENLIAPRFPAKKFRSTRHKLKPSPDAVFTHPLTGCRLALTVTDLSGSGFSVWSEEEEALLPTGLQVQDIQLSFAGVFTLSCHAQVVHRREVGERRGKRPGFLYGFAFVDMPLSDHLKLQRIIHQCQSSHSKVCTRLNPEDLWRFFFETGFIYSRKYHAFTENRGLIQDTYSKLYSQSPDISRHFTCQENGGILGHLSMLRFYENAWLIHHHAALKKAGVRAGLSVLNQVAAFAYNSLWLDACHMRYMFCYFRQENPFPHYFFQGFADRLNNRKGCSTDPFAYLSYRKPAEPEQPLPPSWKTGPCTALDLADLRFFYEKSSDGLMLEALDLTEDRAFANSLGPVYRDSGLTREKHLYSLRHNGDLVAVILVNIADIAINMSDLTSSVTVMVLKPAPFTRDILNRTLGSLSHLFSRKRFPVLLYPADFADHQAIVYQKTYTLWILDTGYSDDYFAYLDQVNTMVEQANTTTQTQGETS